MAEELSLIFIYSQFEKGFMHKAPGNGNSTHCLLPTSKMNRKRGWLIVSFHLQKSQNPHLKESPKVMQIFRTEIPFKTSSPVFVQTPCSIFLDQGRHWCLKLSNSTWHGFTFFKIVLFITQTLAFLRLSCVGSSFSSFFLLRSREEV